jgi:hypothetical protein
MTSLQEIPAHERKMRALALYLTARSEGDPRFSPAKLNKLLFYCDFTAYRQLGCSITGYSYQKLPSGPAPKAMPHVFNSSALSIEELRLADQIIEDLWESNAGEVSSHPNDFIGWRAADLYEIIPYETAFLGDPSMPVSKDEAEFCKQLEQGTI